MGLEIKSFPKKQYITIFQNSPRQIISEKQSHAFCLPCSTMGKISMGESPGKNSENCIGYMILKIFGVALAMHLGLRNEHFHFWFWLFFMWNLWNIHWIGDDFFKDSSIGSMNSQWLIYSGNKWFVTHLIPFSGHWEGSKRCWVNVYGYSNLIIPFWFTGKPLYSDCWQDMKF